MMMNKKRKEDILNDIYGMYPPNFQIPPSLQNSPMGYELQRSVNEAIRWYSQEVARRIIENLYTQEEFEEDLGLK